MGALLCRAIRGRRCDAGRCSSYKGDKIVWLLERHECAQKSDILTKGCGKTETMEQPIVENGGEVKDGDAAMETTNGTGTAATDVSCIPWCLKRSLQCIEKRTCDLGTGEGRGEQRFSATYLTLPPCLNHAELCRIKAEGEVEDADYAENEVYKKLRSQNVKPKVAVALMQLYESTEMSPEDMDERAIDMLRSFPIEHAIFVIGEACFYLLPVICLEESARIVSAVKKSNLLGVQNHAQFMMSMMRNFRDKVRQLGAQSALNETLVTGPSYENIKAILDRTGYPLEVTNGQRKYGGPPPDWEGPATGPAGAGHEIYIGKIPNEIYEDTLIPLFEEVGKIWDLRLMMDPLTGKNRGYAFITFCEKNCAAEAAKKFDGHEILPGKNLKVNVSVANTRLFIGNIPKSKSKEEILAEFKEHTGKLFGRFRRNIVSFCECERRKNGTESSK
ncbi:unnamed protein product [Toxocara canis]|uniref:RRM domain-containing protein n=1 Tax=Toxocara canis TaxID=6265 RepID=A0A183VCM1_TOXCA|nr:unnamed protein product [Toxocara canis]